ncbi:nuclear division cycle 1 [Arctopsyche grandis]|uniref:nuclear division cycle 1 n=1 Tax=Arctopsyche grandis TaxID=121162 RepID=UPI00406D7B7E
MSVEECRSVVRRRCGRAALAAGGAAVLAGGASAAPLTLLLTAATATTTALVNSTTLTRAPPPPTHRTGRVLSLLRPLRAATILLHATYGLLTSLTCLATLKLTLTHTCPNSTNKCLHEQSLLILFAGIFNGVYYYLKTYVFDDPIVNFPLVEQRKFIRIKLSIYPTLKRAMYDSITPIIFTALFYYWKGHLFRNATLYIYNANLDDEPLDGLLSTLSFPLIIYLWFNSTLFLSTVYFALLSFDIYLTEHLKFPIESSDNIPTLAQELSGDVEILNKLAARDLLYLAYSDRERRQQIFSLSLPGGHPTNWKNLSNECINIINAYTFSIESITCDTKQAEENKSAKVHQLILSPEPFQHHSLRNLAMSPPQSPLSPNSMNQFVISNEEIKPFKDMVRDEFRSFVNNLCKKPGINFFFGELTDIKIKHVAHRGQVIAKVSQGFAHLATASLDEDVYGVVQDDLARIITSLLQLKLALDKLTKSGMINRKNLKQDSTPIQMLNELKSAIKRSIYKITISFKDYMQDIVLDSDIHLLLQPFINFREG